MRSTATLCMAAPPLAAFVLCSVMACRSLPIFACVCMDMIVTITEELVFRMSKVPDLLGPQIKRNRRNCAKATAFSMSPERA